MPPILVVCPTVAEAEQWARIVSNSADRRGCDPLTLYLTTLSSITKKSAIGPIWRRLDGTLGLPLAERLRWTLRLPALLENVLESRGPTVLLPLNQPAGPKLAGSASVLPVAQRTESNVTERLARAALTTSSVQKEVLEWVGHHPYLSSHDLSVLLNLGKQVVEKHLLSLDKPALVGSVVRRVEREDIASPRYFLTQDGLKLLAARDGVPPQRYGRRGVLAAEGDGGSKGGMRLAGLLRYFDHTVGANSFFVRLAAEAREPDRRASHRFVGWLSAAEGQEWFRWRDRSWHIWPDGRGVYEFGGRRFDVLLEWERGRTRRRDLTEKFESYATWLEVRGCRRDGIRLLIVTASSTMEEEVLDLARKAAGLTAPLLEVVFVTTQSRWASSGGLAACWRWAPADSSRKAWWETCTRS